MLSLSSFFSLAFRRVLSSESPCNTCVHLTFMLKADSTLHIIVQKSITQLQKTFKMYKLSNRNCFKKEQNDCFQKIKGVKVYWLHMIITGYFSVFGQEGGQIHVLIS